MSNLALELKREEKFQKTIWIPAWVEKGLAAEALKGGFKSIPELISAILEARERLKLSNKKD
jgi:hypothetical protein